MKGIVSSSDFLDEVDGFLSAQWPVRTTDTHTESVALFEHADPETLQMAVKAARSWARTRYEAGFGWIDGPIELGGRGLPKSFADLYRERETRYDIFDMSSLTVGLGMVAPTIVAHGSEVARRSLAPAIHRGDIVACQLFSEPGAGSDLASLSLRAVRHGDSWSLTGQKVWTSMAQVSDVGEILCRTSDEGPPQAGITAFVVDMDQPGVTVRPLRQLTGGATFNEVFFDDVKVDDDRRLGAVGDGWNVARTTLMHERAAVASGLLTTGPGIGSLPLIFDEARRLGQDDPISRQLLARLHERTFVQNLLTERLLHAAQGGVPGPDFSLAKLSLASNLQEAAETIAHVLGPRLIADADEGYRWSEFVLGVPGYRIAGGTDEVLRNVIGERVLGLPKEPR